MSAAILAWIMSRVSATSRSAAAILQLSAQAACPSLARIAYRTLRDPFGIQERRHRRRAFVLAAAERADAVERAKAFGRLRNSGEAEYRRCPASRASA